MVGDNSAQLLYEHLRSMRKSSADRKKVIDVLASVLHFEVGDHVAARRALGLVDELFPATASRLHAIPGLNPEVYTRDFQALRNGLAGLSLASGSAGAFNFITEAAVEALRLCAARLAEALPGGSIEEDDVANLANQIDELAEWARSAGIEPVLRDFTLDVCEVLRRAVFELRIRGIDGMERAIEEAVGRLIIFWGRNTDQVSKEGLRRVWNVVVYAESIMARVLTYGPVLSDGLNRLLGTGG